MWNGIPSGSGWQQRGLAGRKAASCNGAGVTAEASLAARHIVYLTDLGIACTVIFQKRLLCKSVYIFLAVPSQLAANCNF